MFFRPKEGLINLITKAKFRISLFVIIMSQHKYRISSHFKTRLNMHLCTYRCTHSVYTGLYCTHPFKTVQLHLRRYLNVFAAKSWSRTWPRRESTARTWTEHFCQWERFWTRVLKCSKIRSAWHIRCNWSNMLIRVRLKRVRYNSMGSGIL